MDLDVREVAEDELKALADLEAESYPDDEAAEYDMLVYRQKEAPDLFLGCYHGDVLIGFVCATRYHGNQLTHESMNMHIPNGVGFPTIFILVFIEWFRLLPESVCIHSVVVRKSHRRKGIALTLLKEFAQKVWKEQRDVLRILLICKANLIPLYTRAGFVLNGKSQVVHGKDAWYEMAITAGRR